MKYLKSGTLIAAVAMLAAAVTMSADAGGPKGSSIVDVAVEANWDTNSPYFGKFDILITALETADSAIIEYLDSSNGQRTVFAPVDDAFLAIGFDEEAVANIDPGLLTDLLLYHVIQGRRNSKSVLGSRRIRMLDGGVVLQDGGVLTDSQDLESNIIATDIMAANGIIHAVDAVLLSFEL